MPIRVQHLILTFACTDFEEVNPICKLNFFLCFCNCIWDFLFILGETESPTTYHVKCLYDQEQKTYRASFFISEVDKVNLNWYRVSKQVPDERISQIRTKLELGIFFKKFVKLKEDLHCLARM